MLMLHRQIAAHNYNTNGKKTHRKYSTDQTRRHEGPKLTEKTLSECNSAYYLR
jgi:hypothetical protein